MQLIYPDDGLVAILTAILNDGVLLKLYKNDHTPTRGSTLASLTEADWAGYAAIALDDTDFGTTGVVANVGFALGAPQAFTNSSGSAKEAYGYYLTNAAETKLLAVARFDGAPISKEDAEQWLVTPAIGDFSSQS